MNVSSLKAIKNQRASASIAEFTLVLPLCLIIVGALILFGFYLCRYAVLDSAADRAVLIIRSAYSDPNYFAIADLGTDENDPDHIGIESRSKLYGLCESDPYRFILNKSGYDDEEAKEEAVKKIRQIIDEHDIISGGLELSDIDVALNSVQGIFETRIRVTVRQRVVMPPLIDRLLGSKSVVMEAASEGSLSYPPELIRNTDFVLDLAERYTGKNIQKEITGVLSKATSFITGN